MTGLFTLALELQDCCLNQGWPFCFIGGLAVQHWGEPRLTHDVEGVITRQGADNLDWGHVFHYLTPLAEVKEQPEIVDRLHALAGI